MIYLTDLAVLPEAHLRLTFSDGCVKVLDVHPYISSAPMTAPLADPAYFARVALYPDGRGIFWPNDYDMCPDWLRYHAPAVTVTFADSPIEAPSIRS